MVMFNMRMRPEVIQPFWAALQARGVHQRRRGGRRDLSGEGPAVDPGRERDPAASRP